MKMNENIKHKNSAVSCFYEGNTFTLEVLNFFDLWCLWELMGIQLPRVLVRKARVEIRRRFA